VEGVGVKRLLWLLALLVVVPSPAHAHLMNTGLGPFYDGLAHLFVSPEDLLPVIALACLAGLRGPRFGRAVLFALPAAWLAGAVAGSLLPPPFATAFMTIALGAMVAADKPWPLWLVVGGAVVLGLLHGSANGAELARQQSVALGTLGIAAALFVVISLLAGQASAVRSAWGRIVIRVAGSWIAACGLFMLGWAVRVAR
jgi:hydrogenase/urease accessory protein HupE